MSGHAEDRLVLGTAGHIDHGKTTLVHALTGVDTDRLPEEKARGITISLGFASLELEQGIRIDLVDVPGHEGLVRTMVSGASGIDLLLLVVAADEGIMPQTREHLAICRLLGITRMLVALTKIDAVDQETVDLAAGEVEDLLAPTELAGAAVIPVSARTGHGLDGLKIALAKLARDAPPRTPRRGPPRLAIDRSFEMHGFGGVATGTLIGAAVGVGDAIELYPSGLRGRIRGLQAHGSDTERCYPGTRCAVNVQGIPLNELTRGRVISAPDALPLTSTLDTRIDWLDSSPAVDGFVSTEFLSGTSAHRARVAAIGSECLIPGRMNFARVYLAGDPAALLPGDRFVLRGFSRDSPVGATLGGGVVLDAVPPHKRHSDPTLHQNLELLAHRDPEIDIEVRVARSGFSGIGCDALQRETGLQKGTFTAALNSLAARGSVLLASDRGCLSRDACERIEAALLRALEDHHSEQPLRPGMSASSLRGALPSNVTRPAADLVIAKLAERGRVIIDDDVVRCSEHRPTLNATLGAKAESVLAMLRNAGLEPPSLRDLSNHVGLDEAVLRELLAHLERGRSIVRAPGDLWFDAEIVSELREKVRGHFREHQTLDTPDYKMLIGTSRRTAVPLMELFDEERLTMRREGVRRLR